MERVPTFDGEHAPEHIRLGLDYAAALTSTASEAHEAGVADAEHLEEMARIARSLVLEHPATIWAAVYVLGAASGGLLIAETAPDPA